MRLGPADVAIDERSGRGSPPASNRMVEPTKVTAAVIAGGSIPATERGGPFQRWSRLPGSGRRATDGAAVWIEVDVGLGGGATSWDRSPPRVRKAAAASTKIAAAANPNRMTGG